MCSIILLSGVSFQISGWVGDWFGGDTYTTGLLSWVAYVMPGNRLDMPMRRVADPVTVFLNYSR